MTLAYEDFLTGKRAKIDCAGITVDPSSLPSFMFPFQRDITVWALARGRAAIFEGCGLGKTLQELVWSDVVSRHTDAPVLNIAPLTVAMQTVEEGAKFGISVNLCRSQKDVKDGINITNYDMVHHFDPSKFSGVVCDESSIIKGFDSATTSALIEMFGPTPFKLPATATPSPNDYMELGTHAEFLGIMTRAEMLAMFFTHDGGDTSNWRLKGHAENVFWDWVATWAVMMRKPSDLGYSDEGYDLPPLKYHQHVIDVDGVPEDGALFATEALGLKAQQRERKAHVVSRIDKVAELVNGNYRPWVVWCQLNDEADAVTKAIPGAVQVAGRDTREHKEQSMMDFTHGKIRVLVTKGAIFGFGANWQHCHDMVYASLSNSWETMHQTVKRCHRFGQKEQVDAHFVLASTETAILRNLERKEKQADTMSTAMIGAMQRSDIGKVQMAKRDMTEYRRDVFKTKNAELHLGDCVEVFSEMKSDSVDYTIFSPPFDSLYTYSSSDRDMGNCSRGGEFAEHFKFIVPELFRTLRPGRLLSFHCMNLPTSKANYGYIGIRDFRGELIRMFIDAGFIYHSEVCIWKDPVTAMQRTKALGLLHKQVIKDSCMSRQGIPDYLVTMRKPGVNPDPVAGPFTYYVGENPPANSDNATRRSIDIWQQYASPIWTDIDFGDTLNYQAGREGRDERHICPLALPIIRRALQLWTNPGDLVATPFLGVGSEAYVAVEMKRRAVGSELKQSYFDCAVHNIQTAELTANQKTLFDDEDFTA